jgi:uncharacterized Zn finger protein
MHAPELCSNCGAAGSVRRELIINGSNMAVSCHCTKCGRTWEIADQRTQTAHAEPPRERRANGRH